MLAPNRSVLSPEVLRLVAASLAFNGLLLGGVLFALAASVPPVIIAPVFVMASIAEMVFWKNFAHVRQTPPAMILEPRAEALRRTDLRRRNTMIDEATGLYTRWYFERRIEEEAARCKRYKHSMAVVVLRVDVVKLTTFSTDGWQERSLEAAQGAARVVREVDISAMLSPYEFAICLIHCDREGAIKALERLVVQLPGYNCEAGIAVFPDEGYDAPGLLEVATARMRPLVVPKSA